MEPSFSRMKPSVNPKINVQRAQGQVDGTETKACDKPNTTDVSNNPHPKETSPSLNDLPKYRLTEDWKYPLKNSSSPSATIKR